MKNNIKIDFVDTVGNTPLIKLKNGYNNNYQGTNNRNYTSDTTKN